MPITGYKVYRNNILVASPVSSPYADIGLNSDTEYTYQVSAVNEVGEGPKSNPVTVKTLPAPITIPFNGFQNAIDAAPNGALIEVPPGTYRESFTINKPGLTIRGRSAGVIVTGKDTAGTVVRSTWATITANDVTVDNIAFEHAASPLQQGGFKVGPTIIGVKLLNLDMGYARGANLQFAGQGLVDNVTLHHGGQLGLHYALAKNTIFRRLKLLDNNTPRPYESYMSGNSNYIVYPGTNLWYVNPGWESGGSKGVGHINTIFEDGEVARNTGPGLWTDSVPAAAPHSKDMVIRRMRVHDNTSGGIFFEVSDGGEIYENICWNNGGAPSTTSANPYLGGNITISSSKRVSVHNNYIKDGKVGINYFGQNRSDSPGHGDVHIFNNDVISTTNTYFAITVASDGPDVFTSSNSYGNRIWYPVAETGARFAFNGWHNLSGFNGVASKGNPGSVYMTTATKDSLLTRFV